MYIINSDRWSVIKVPNYLEPGQHQLLRWELGTPDLVVDNQRPNKAQDQLQVAVYNVKVA